jgi:hypothetical protein
MEPAALPDDPSTLPGVLQGESFTPPPIAPAHKDYLQAPSPDPAPMGMAGQAPGLFGISPTQHAKAFGAGVLGGLPSIDLFDKPKFTPQEGFDPYSYALNTNNEYSIDSILTAKSPDEAEWFIQRDKEGAERRHFAAQRSPFAAGAGTVAAMGFYPTTYIPIVGMSNGALVGILKNTALMTGTATVEQGVMMALDSRRTLKEAATNVAIATVVGAVAATVLRKIAPDQWRGGSPDEITRNAVRAEAEAARARGEGSGVDPYEPVGAPAPAGATAVDGADAPRGSAGALALPGVQTEAEIIAGNAMQSAFGLEKLKNILTPLMRLSQNTTVSSVSELFQQMHEIPFALAKNALGLITDPNNVEAVRRRVWGAAQLTWRKAVDEEYFRHLEELGQKVRLNSTAITNAEQAWNKTGHTAEDFYHQIYLDMAHGHVDGPGWQPTSAVRRASLAQREVFDKLIDDALALDLHNRDTLRKLAQTSDPAEIQRLTQEMADRTDAIRANKHKYVNVMFNKGKIKRERDAFVRFVAGKKRISRVEAELIVDEVLRKPPFEHITEESRVGQVRAMHSRELVDDPLDWIDWLETDAVTTGSIYIRQMSADVELARKFGTVDMADQLAVIRADYEDKIKAATSKKEADALKAELDEVLNDLKAMRDTIRGTYMIPPDPEHVASRSIRVFRHLNTMRLLTGAIAAVPDLAKLMTANGLMKTSASLFEMLRTPGMYKLAKDEANMVAEAGDLITGSTAAKFADIGEAHGVFTRAEKLIASAAHLTFQINLMNFWNETMKSMSSLVLATKILTDVEMLAAGTASARQINRLAQSGIDAERARLIMTQAHHWERTEANILAQTASWTDAAAQDAFRAALSREINIVVVTPGLAERPLWMSQTLDKTFRIDRTPTPQQNAELRLIAEPHLETIQKIRDQLKQDTAAMTRAKRPQADIDALIERRGQEIVKARRAIEDEQTIFRQAQGIMPVSNWLSQPYLSLVGQFKSFAISNVYRTMIPAMQTKGADSLAMISIATGLGMVIDGVRSNQTGAPGAGNLFEAILGGFDRSGLIGWYAEPENMLSRLSGNTIGLHALVSSGDGYTPSPSSIAGTIGGPSAGLVGDALTGVWDMFNRDGDHAAKTIRSLTPFGRVSHLDWMFDRYEDALAGGLNTVMLK